MIVTGKGLVMRGQLGGGLGKEMVREEVRDHHRLEREWLFQNL